MTSDLLAPLHIAAQNLCPQLIEVLLMHPKTDIELTSAQHGTVLHVACAVSSVKIV